MKFVGIMSSRITTADKQYTAKILYTRERLPQNVVAKRVGISPKTMCAWVEKFSWDKLKKRLLVSKEEEINQYYEELEEIRNVINAREKGHRYANTKEADIRIKTTASIKNLETDLGIAEKVESGIQFIKHMQQNKVPMDEILKISDYWNSFIQASIKK